MSEQSWCFYGSKGTNLAENHSRDLLGGENLGLAEVLDLDERVSTLVNDLERPGLDVLLDRLIVEPPANQTPVAG
jgi:NAD-specific glutamate dehydrogenase